MKENMDSNYRIESSIKPSFKNNFVTAVFTCDDKYAPYLVVALLSLIKNSSDSTCYEIIVISDNLSDSSKHTINSLISSKKNFVIKFINIYKNVKNLKLTTNLGYSSAVYYKILSPYVLVNYKRLLVFDCDIVFKSDIKNLFDINCDNNVVLGVADLVFQGLLNGKDESTKKYALNILKLNNPYNYINSGVLLIDCEKYRKLCPVSKMINYCSLKYDGQDQDILNSVFQNSIGHLDNRWNYFVKSNYFVKTNIRHSNSDMHARYKIAAKETYIIHFAARPKPWENKRIEFADVWWKFAKETPYYNYFLVNLKKSPYNKNLFNRFIDFLFPLFSRRRRILKSLAPSFLSKKHNLK